VSETRYFRTARGSHRHADFYCANVRRSIMLGPVTELAADEAADWAPCDVCCTGHEVTAHAVTVQAKTAARCRNRGVERPNRIYSVCRDCGKEGKVDRRTGSLRAHEPQR
jgi:hypothetical protein